MSNPMSVFSHSSSWGNIPLAEQHCDPAFRTPEHLTSCPNTRIHERVMVAEEIAKDAAVLCRDGMDLDPALEIARAEHDSWYLSRLSS